MFAFCSCHPKCLSVSLCVLYVHLSICISCLVLYRKPYLERWIWFQNTIKRVLRGWCVFISNENRISSYKSLEEGFLGSTCISMNMSTVFMQEINRIGYQELCSHFSTHKISFESICFRCSWQWLVTSWSWFFDKMFAAYDYDRSFLALFIL